MALRQAKIQPALNEKRYITLQFLEAAFMSGNRVIITPVDTKALSVLSKETFTYKSSIETYIIYDERPKVSLLKKLGWFREDAEELPQIAIIPTHLLYDKKTGKVVNELLLQGQEFQDLVVKGESENYELRPLEIKRGTFIDVFYDFAPETSEPNPELTKGFYFKQDESTVINRFYVTESRIDTVSINYTCKLMSWKYQGIKEDTAGNDYLDAKLPTGGID